MAKKYNEFNKQQAKTKKLLTSLDVDEDTQNKILDAYKDELISDIRYERHKADFDIGLIDEMDFGVSYPKYTDKYLEAYDYYWVDELENDELIKGIKRCSEEEIKIIDLFVYKGYSQSEISEVLCTSQSSVSRSINRVRGKINISGIRS